ncbi:MAG: tripartite tricarboxylate transporter substrate binding protein [Rhodospirillales bacterium]|nr:MAG: tripartite tricarboxylate transporter substrate binding protein [Rhodospirillales bacterium]
MIRGLTRRGALAALGAAPAVPALAQADAYPSRQPIRLVVPFPPGGGTDALARMLAEPLKERLGQSIVIENKPGAGSNLAHEYVAKLPGDGYAILVSGGNLRLFPYMIAKLGYDPKTAFATFGFLGKQESVLVGSANAPWADVKAVLAAAKAEPGRVQFGTAGVTTPMHLAGEQFGLLNGTRLTHVPFKGTGPLVADLLGGHIQLGVSSLSSVEAYFADKRLRPYALASKERSPLAPDVPTFREMGCGDVEGAIVYTLAVPSSTPKAIVRRLNGTLTAVTGSPAVAEQMRKRGFVAMPGTPEILEAWLDEQERIWGPVMVAAGIKPE